MLAKTEGLTNEGTLRADPVFEPDQFQFEFCRLIGSPDSIPAKTLVDQIIGDLIQINPENQEEVNLFLAIVAEQKPKTVLEAQLIAQIMATHQLFTRMLHKAGKESWPENINKYTNIALKLSRGFKQGLETLSKCRRNGQQSIYIEHVNLEKDAQAVIGSVERG